MKGQPKRLSRDIKKEEEVGSEVRRAKRGRREKTRSLLSICVSRMKER